MRAPGTPLRSARRNQSSTLNKTSILCYKSPKITRPGSISPVEVVTFLQESENEKLTEDWSKSLLYQKIANLDGIELDMTEQEMKVLSRKPPRDPEEIFKAMNKGLALLRVLLMELLGTKEDMQRFEERFKGNSRYHVRALMERCLNLVKVRNSTADILQKIHKREMILKNLKATKNKIKDKVLKVFEMNKEIRADIETWATDESVPFTSFTFKGKNYLMKISEDLVVLQEYLDRISAKGLNKSVNEVKNWTLRKTFLLRRAVRPNNVIDRGKKFEIEDLFEFPKPSPKVKKEIKRTSSVSTVVVSEPEQKPRRYTRKKSEIFTINPNLNSNFTINTFSLSNMRLRNYTYNPKPSETKLKVVIAGSKFH